MSLSLIDQGGCEITEFADAGPPCNPVRPPRGEAGGAAQSHYTLPGRQVLMDEGCCALAGAGGRSQAALNISEFTMGF